MIVFDITDEQSYQDAVNYWFQEIKQSCSSLTQILLIGNKSDLSEERKVSRGEIDSFLGGHPEVKYIETSAKTSEKIEEAFVIIGEMLLELEERLKENGKDKKKIRRQHDGKYIRSSD
jgi:GTPase SAR1 family protein